MCSPGQPLLVWGVGQLAMKLLAETSLGKANIAGFVDSNPIHQGKKLHGHPILIPWRDPGDALPDFDRLDAACTEY